MKTEYLLAQTLKRLMSNKVPLDEINVTMLTKKCKVNRQTFYYHFHDIYDLLTLVFLNEKIEGSSSATTIDRLLTLIYEHYNNNQSFIDETLDSAAKDLYITFIQNVCYQSFLKMIIVNDTNKEISISQRKSFANFYSSGFAKIISNYFIVSKIKSFEGLKALFAFIPKDFVANAIKNFKKDNIRNG